MAESKINIFWTNEDNCWNLAKLGSDSEPARTRAAHTVLLAPPWLESSIPFTAVPQHPCKRRKLTHIFDPPLPPPYAAATSDVFAYLHRDVPYPLRAIQTWFVSNGSTFVQEPGFRVGAVAAVPP